MSTRAIVSRDVVQIRPGRGLFDLDLGALWRYRELWTILIMRDVKVRYRQAALGAGWALIQPIFTVMIATVVFGHFAKLPSDGVPYPLFALAATLPWQYFQEAVRRASVGLVADAELVRKVYFPRLVLPLASVTGPLVDFAITLVVVMVALLWFGVAPTWRMLFIPVFLSVAMLLSLAVALWLAPINAKFRDIMHTIPFMVQVWLYATPVFYSVSIVPAHLRPFYSLNPMVGVIEGFRWAVLAKARPDLTSMLISLGVIGVLLISGLVWFKSRERSLADVI
jgi:homopolymeric O-antigen transport system permease protein